MELVRTWNTELWTVLPVLSPGNWTFLLLVILQIQDLLGDILTWKGRETKAEVFGETEVGL